MQKKRFLTEDQIKLCSTKSIYNIVTHARRSGLTMAFMMIAIYNAINGRDVLFVADNNNISYNTKGRLLEIITKLDLMEDMYLSTKNQIHFKNNSQLGRIVFSDVGRIYSDTYGSEYDCILLDLFRPIYPEEYDTLISSQIRGACHPTLFIGCSEDNIIENDFMRKLYKSPQFNKMHFKLNPDLW